jgi:hypothetical protein
LTKKIPYEKQIVKMFSELKSREKTTGINLKKMILIKIKGQTTIVVYMGTAQVVFAGERWGAVTSPEPEMKGR